MTQTIYSFNRTWIVRRPIVIREMEAKYVDDFFRDGSLRLSSFELFRSHHDEDRRDEQEGLVSVQIAEPNGTFNIAGISGQGVYIFCTSLVEPNNTENNSHKAHIKIKDTLSFADAVSRQVKGFLHGIEGHCIYQENKTVYKIGNRPLVLPTNDAEAQLFEKQTDAYASRQSIDAFFMKNPRYSSEAEYRFIWFTEGSEHPFIDIKCPAAIRFCERV